MSMDLKLLRLMEDFVLKEIDYSQEHGYSGRAKRYMRRKLSNELAPFLEKMYEDEDQDDDQDQDDDDSASENDTEPEAESVDENTLNKLIHRDYKIIHDRIDLCFLMAYLMFLGSLYTSIAYLIFSYKEVHILPGHILPGHTLPGQCLNSSKSCL